MTSPGPESPEPAADSYDRSFFEGQAAASLQSARVVLGRVFSMVRPRRVLDVGCGTGPWMRAALDLGAAEVLGVDGDYVDRSMLLVDPGSFIPADLASQRLRDVLGAKADTPFDLVVCMEVAEHLPFERAPSLVAELSLLADLVLFSAAVPFQFGTQHINEQWPEFWSILFRAHGFACFDCLRADLWAAPGVDWWYAQNAMLFARDGSEAASGLPAARRAEGKGLSLVHPENLLANLLGLPRRYRLQAAQEEVQDLRSLIAANLRLDATLPTLAAPARAAAAGPDVPGVFPGTRMHTYQPEEEIAALSRRLTETGAFLETANAAFMAERAKRTEVETALIGVQAELQVVQAELHRLRDLTQRLQTQSTARMVAETRLADFQADEKNRHRALVDQLNEERQAMLAEAMAAHEALAEARQALDADWGELRQKRAALDQRSLQLEASEGAIEAVQRSRTWRLTTRALQLAGRRPAVAEPMQPSLPTIPDGVTEAVPCLDESVLDEPRLDEALPEAEQPEPILIKRFEVVMGQVQWWTLAAAKTRLQRLDVFDAADYLRRNPDVAAAGMDPYTHFIQSGALEGRGHVDPEDLARLMGGLMLFDNAVRALPPKPASEVDLPALVADVGPIGLYVSTRGNVFMNDLAEDLAADLRSIGVPVTIQNENADIEARPVVCVYIAPHEFFTLGRGPDWIREDVLYEGFVFGTEQIQTSWFNTALPFTLMARGTLDLCAQTADLFARLDMATLHVLPGVRQRPRPLKEQDHRHPLFRVLPAAAQAEIDPSTPFRARSIDISFFGTSSPRRDQFFARNAAFFADYETFNYCRRPGRGPILMDSEDGPLSRLAGHVCGHSKISLNIHREEFGYFEWHRMIRHGMCGGSLVVSDPCLPHPSFVANEHYLQESARHIPDLLEWLLTTKDGEHEAERVRSNANKLITETYDVKRTATELLSFFARHRSRER